MQYSKWAAIGICIAIVVGAYAAWDYSTSTFNPNPGTTSLSQTDCSASVCGRFGILSANLTMINSTDIISQYVDLSILPEGVAPMTSIQIYINGTSLGAEPGPFQLNTVRNFEIGVPTSIIVEDGSLYQILVRAVYSNSTSADLGTVSAAVFVVAVK